jgi:glycosyltransferase involved in cell wall biosynthesis
MRRPWVLTPAGPVLWQSHQFIHASLTKLFEEIPCRIEKLWFPNPRVSKAWIEEARKSASCFVLLPSASESLEFIAQLRREHDLRVPLVMMIAGDFVRGGAQIFARKSLLWKSDRFVTHSMAEYELVRDALPQHEGIHLIRLPVSRSEMFSVSAKEKKRLRQKLGIKSREKFLVYAGQVTPQKNVHGLIRAVTELKRRGHRFKLMIVGGLEARGSATGLVQTPHWYGRFLSELVCKFELENEVKFTGRLSRSELQEYFSACDAHISLTLFDSEDFGYSAAEGISCGAPAILTHWGGSRDFIQAGAALGVPVRITKNGPRADISAVPSLIEKVLRNNFSLRKRALDFAASHLQGDKILSEWRDLFSRTFAEMPTPGISVAQPYMDYLFEHASLFSEGRVPTRTDPLVRRLLAARNRTERPELFLFETPDHPLALRINEIYAGQGRVSISKDAEAYLHPFFSIASAGFDDPLIARRSVPLDAREKRTLIRWFSKPVRWKKLRGHPLAQRLEAQGAILISESKRARRKICKDYP